MYLVYLTKKVCVYCATGFIISGILYVQAVKAEEIESNFLGEKFSRIAKLLESIPEYSRNLYIGPLRLYPTLEISEAYDDNVFDAADPDLVKADFYTTIKNRPLQFLHLASYRLKDRHNLAVYRTYPFAVHQLYSY